MNRFQKSVSHAFCTAKSVNGISVTYFVDATHWVRLAAIPGQTNFQSDDGNGVIVDYTSRDYIVSACELVVNGQRVDPADGHYIKEEVGNKVHTYMVRREDGAQPWRFADAGRTNLRIHTKLDSKVAK